MFFKTLAVTSRTFCMEPFCAPLKGGNLDPSDVPAVVEVFSKSSGQGTWFVGLVVKQEQELLTIRFFDECGERKEKLLALDAEEVDYFGSHLGWPTPPSVVKVPSTTRKGQVSYLDPAMQQKFATPELAWQAYLEQHLKHGHAPERHRCPTITPLNQPSAAQGSPPTLMESLRDRGTEPRSLTAKISQLCEKSLERSDLGDLLGPRTEATAAGRLAEELAAARAEAVRAVQERRRSAARRGT